MTTNRSTTAGRRSPLQHWLEIIGSHRSDPRRSAQANAPSYAAVVRAQQGQPVGGWDPHEVWLDRIKKPRDERRR